MCSTHFLPTLDQHQVPKDERCLSQATYSDVSVIPEPTAGSLGRPENNF